MSNREQIDFDEVNNHDYQYADDDASPSTNKVQIAAEVIYDSFNRILYASGNAVLNQLILILIS